MSPAILVIDDEPQAPAYGPSPRRATPSRRLRTPPWRCLDGKRVDLIILDLGLPDMRGHDRLRVIRTSHPGLPVAVLSSRDDEGGTIEALDLGADDDVTKPFGMAELLARLRAALRHQRAAGANGRCSASTVSRLTACGAS